MKWKVRKPGARYRLWLKKRNNWHPWFVWHPVRVPTRGKGAGKTMVWMETVQRKGEYWSCQFGSGWYWEYKF